MIFFNVSSIYFVLFLRFCYVFILCGWLAQNRCQSLAQRQPVWQVKLIHWITARLPRDSLALLTEPLLPWPPSYRHKPPRPHQCPRGSIFHLGQRVLGVQLWRRLPADILSLVRPCVSHPSMLCFLLFLLPMHYQLLLKMSFSGLCSEQLWKQRHGKNMDVPCVWVFSARKKKKVATKLNMTQTLYSCCCYCFAAAWLGKKKSCIHFSYL